MTNSPSIVLATGGTAGHIEPALNTADAILRAQPRARITVIGSERGLETTLVPARGFDLRTVPAVPMPRKPSLDWARLPGRVRAAKQQAESILREVNADAVIGFGGYASVPAYRAARSLGVPVIVHEANARPGLANRMGARHAREVVTVVPGTLPGATVMGMPLRASISGLDRTGLRHAARAHFGLHDERPVLLVFGGSQGAMRLNAAVEAALPQLLDAGFEVLHSYGSRNQPPVAPPGYVALPYIDRMDLAYAAADLAVVRAGAMTCAELAAVGLPAIYVPLPIGNGEQRLNALPVIDAGGGMLIADEDLSGTRLAREVLASLGDPARLTAMSAAAGSFGIRDADDRLAELVLDVAKGSAR